VPNLVKICSIIGRKKWPSFLDSQCIVILRGYRIAPLLALTLTIISATADHYKLSVHPIQSTRETAVVKKLATKPSSAVVVVCY